MFGLGPFEIVVIGAIAVMLYGKRLPEVGRSFGKTLGDLRRQWQTLARELETAASVDAAVPPRGSPRSTARIADEPAGARLVETPRFEPPAAE